MNIFVLDKDPQIAASMACDKHVIKMILETAQMLCAAGAAKGYEMPYNATHKHHPCTLWAGQSRDNWDWLIEHGMALSREYTKRYGKIHKSQRVIEYARAMNIMFDKQELTPFAQAMPEQYKNDCVVTAYRAYYMGEKARFATWKTNTPDWWNAGVAQR